MLKLSSSTVVMPRPNDVLLTKIKSEFNLHSGSKIKDNLLSKFNQRNSVVKLMAKKSTNVEKLKKVLSRKLPS